MVPVKKRLLHQEHFSILCIIHALSERTRCPLIIFEKKHERSPLPEAIIILLPSRSCMGKRTGKAKWLHEKIYLQAFHDAAYQNPITRFVLSLNSQPMPGSKKTSFISLSRSPSKRYWKTTLSRRRFIGTSTLCQFP